MEKGRNLRSVNTDGGVNLQFKLLSAIGIIIIVSGHCYHGGMELVYNWFPPYSYHLALFVFISGYFYKTDYLSLIHISEPTRQAEISYAVFCLKKKKKK